MAQYNNTGGTKLPEPAKDIVGLIIMFAVVLVISIILNSLLIFNIEVKGDLMEETVKTNDRAVGFKTAYAFGEPERFDIIAFEQHGDTVIGRIIGLPEDTVKIIDGKIYVNASNTPLDESSYLTEGMLSNIKPFFVPTDCYFVMGDNRSYYSTVSEPRESDFVSRKDIEGKLSIKIYPEIKFLK